MGQTVRVYPIREIALSVLNNRDLASGHERTQEGDIVAIRKPGLPAIGLKEASRFVWLRIRGKEELLFDRLTDAWTDPLDADEPSVRYEKRRYCIPLPRLAVAAPFIDLGRIRDPSDLYQPFMNIDLDDDQPLTYQHFFLNAHRPLQIEGLVFDKAMGAYL